MNEIVLSAEVISWENSLLECSEIRLRCSSIKDANQSPNYASNESRQIYSIVIGLPSEASLQELQSFFDPMKSETEDITFLFEDRSMPVEYLFSQPSLNLSQGQTKFYELRQRKVFALVKFPTEAKRNLFNALYHNMPFNSYTNCAPCIVANITNVDIRSNNELLQGKIADHFLSSLSSLKGEPISEAHEKASAVVEQSNISHSPLFIPTCSLCIRRLNTAKQLLSFNAIVSDQEIAVGRSFHCNSIVSKSQIIEDCEESSSGLLVRCIICYTYHFYQSKEATNTRSGTDNGKLDITVSKEPQIPELCSCFNCGRLESVWVCMICGFTGCSRYTQKHAECHFLASSHQFSLELASGRIWQYSLERYAHCEDSSTLYNNLIQHHTNLQFESLPTGQPPSSHPSNPPQSLHTASVNKVLVSDSYLREQDHQLVKSLHEDKVDKLDSLTSEYERMIEFQLRDQQLYYEKLLARETVRAMEYSFNLQRGKLQRHHQHLHHSYPFGSDLSSEPFFTSHMVDGGTTAGKNSANGLDFEEEADMIIDQELEEIEKIKLEISMIEVEYKKLLDHLKESEERTRLQKKTNDTILKEQKQLKLQEQEYLLKEEALRKQFSDEVQDLEQQITDLSFFLRTKKKMDASPYKEEIANGVIITGEVPLSSKKSFKSHQKKR